MRGMQKDPSKLKLSFDRKVSNTDRFSSFVLDCERIGTSLVPIAQAVQRAVTGRFSLVRRSIDGY